MLFSRSPNDQCVREAVTCVVAEGVGHVLLKEEKAQGDLVMVLQYKNGGYGEGIGSSLSPDMHCDRTRSDGHKVLQERCLWMQGAFSSGDRSNIGIGCPGKWELASLEVFEIQLDKALGNAIKGPAFS